MATIYYPRALETALTTALSQFPAVLVTGARQAGKSTLLCESLPGFRYASLDDPALRALAERDPRLFLGTNRPPVIIDEIQYAPGLLSYLKLAIDEKRDERGRFALTGSQVFPMMQGVTETLAGRIAVLQLYPFSTSELPEPERSRLEDDLGLGAYVVRGAYPELIAHPDLDRNRWFASYVTTYLERDVRNVKRVADLSRFQSFLSLLATRAGGLLNLSEVGRECGISQPTARDWLTVLQSTYIVQLLPPWHANQGKRVVRTPKLYFVDTGLLCHLLGIDSAERFFRSAERGHVFENLVVMEALKRVTIAERRTHLYFYRTASGLEIDLLLERGGRLRACEIKLAKTVDVAMAANLRRARPDLGFSRGTVLTMQDDPLPLTAEISSDHFTRGLDAILA